MTPEEEERGWEELRGRWGEDDAHRAWLAGFGDLEGLARAGQRYRSRLAEDADDPVAKRWLAEIVKRATVHGLASLPRTRPPPPVSPRVVRVAAAVAGVAAAYALYRIVQQLLAFASVR